MTNIEEASPKTSLLSFIVRIVSLLIILFLFLVSLDLMAGAFKLFGKETAQQIMNATSNPFVGLFIGLLATAIIQSSSTTTSMIVAMVAAGSLSIEGAVPIVIGANIGTSVTAMIVSFGYIGKKKEYRKAIATASAHNFINIFITLLLFPLEHYFGFLSHLAQSIAVLFTFDSSGSTEIFSIMKVTVKPVAKSIIHFLGSKALIVLLLSGLLLFFSIYFLTRFLKKMLVGKAQKKLDKLLFKNPYRALGWGIGLTAAVQSSSITTSLIVPLVATNKVGLRKAFPFLMGANIGTTVTALIAALSQNQEALTIAFVHVLFNVMGVAVFLPVKAIRNIPIRLARRLGKATLKNRIVGVGYVVTTFFFIPFLLIFFTRTTVLVREYKYIQKDIVTGEVSYKIIYSEKIPKTDQTSWSIYTGLDKDSIGVDAIAEKNIIVYRDKNILHIGDEYFILTKKGFCWDNVGRIDNPTNQDMMGKYKICVDNIVYNYKLNNDIRIDTCYVLTRNYYNPQPVDSTYDIIYLDVHNQVIFKIENRDKHGNLVFLEELRSIYP
ncbi:MAG: Na/Pi cotransporter family protein [Cytophagales bacterium]|nr:Na/Pi cotransporter family protein [Cytophagales bacterium]